MSHANGLPSYTELTTLSKETIFANIDQTLGGTINEWRLMYAQLLRDELGRREQEQSTSKMLEFTQQVRTATVVILVATVVNVALAAVMLLRL
jgi:hypothetical protein